MSRLVAKGSGPEEIRQQPDVARLGPAIFDERGLPSYRLAEH